MDIEDMVLTRAQMNHLIEMGLNVKDTAFCWVEYTVINVQGTSTEFRVDHADNKLNIYLPTLTLEEILSILPADIYPQDNERYELTLYKDDGAFTLDYVYLFDGEPGPSYVGYNSERSYLEAAYSMLCWVIENKYLNNESKN